MRFRLVVFLCVIVLAGLVAFVLIRGRSPGFGEIAFARDGDIWMVNSDGSGLRRLISDGYNAHPIWSRDGKRMAFSRSQHPGQSNCGSDVWVASADGQSQRRVATYFWVVSDNGQTRHVANADGVLAYPIAWLPKAEGLLYTGVWPATEDWPALAIAEAKRTSSGLSRIEAWERSAKRVFPKWDCFGGAVALSPDCRQVIATGSIRAYSDSDYPIFDLFLLDYDGARIKKLPMPDDFEVDCLRWHPTKPLVLCTVGSEYWLLDIEKGSRAKLAEAGLSQADGIDWSPDGSHIVFEQSDKDGDDFYWDAGNWNRLSLTRSVWIMNADGSGKRKLLDNACQPNWRKPVKD